MEIDMVSFKLMYIGDISFSIVFILYVTCFSRQCQHMLYNWKLLLT